MLIWKSLAEARRALAKNNTGTAVTIGNFDGVHRGHRAIMAKTRELAAQKQAFAMALSFTNHTASLFGETPLLLNSVTVWRELLAGEGLDILMEVEFDKEFAGLEPEDFFQTWLVEGLKVKALVIGYDFKFGAGGRGDFRLLKQLAAAHDLQIERVAPVTEAGEVISSSKIRRLLAEGRIETANQMLGYNFLIEGEVSHGEKRGRRIGFPTVNLRLESKYLAPCFGVYLVRLFSGKKSFFGLANVGVKPTFGEYAPLVEVHLFDAAGDFYNQSVRVEFLKYIRPENRFADAEALKSQIAKDVATARQLLSVFNHERRS